MPAAPIPSELHAFLAEPNAAVIATLRPDGHPHAVPTWYEWTDGDILVNMDQSRVRLGYMRRDPRVAVSIFPVEDWYIHLSIVGRVREIRRDPDLADIDRLSQRYRGRPYWDRSRRSWTALVEPERWFAHGELKRRA